MEQKNTLKWAMNLAEYPKTKRISKELSLMVKQCQRVIGKDEVELNSKLQEIFDNNANYMGFLGDIVIKSTKINDGFGLELITKKTNLQPGLTTYLRKLDRESSFDELFNQMKRMEDKVLSLGVLTARPESCAISMEVDDYVSAYSPLLDSFEKVHNYFAPTIEEQNSL